jgi:PAS domain S-box-containing protein
MDSRGGTLFHYTFVRYVFAIALVASTFALRLWLIPLTGTGAPFVLFFTAVLVISLAAGIGPGICAIVLSAPLEAYTFATRAGYPPFQAAGQGLLFAVDGLIAVYLTFFMKKERQAAQDANQLRWANEQITRSMTQTREVIELSPDAFFQADLDARFTDVNQAACRLLGYDRDELIGKTIFEIIPVEDRSRLKAVRAELLVPGHVDRAEWSLKRKDGRFVPVEVSAHILPEGRWQALVRDISERKRVEEALQESEERFRLTIDEAPIGMALQTLDGRFVRVNRALCEIVGYSSGELTELTFQAITHPDDVDADLALRGQLARGEIPRYDLGKRYIRRDGTIVDIQLSASILRTREGAPLYSIVQIEDITERKQAEAALKDSERRLTLALDSAQMGMWDLDLLTDTSVRSLRHDQIFGYSTAVPTWGAAVFMTHVVPEDRDVAKRAFEQAFVSDNFDMECRIRWADESIHWISAKGRVYRNPKGDPVRMMGTVLDVTEQKRAQERLKESEAKFSGIISISEDAIISIDAEQRIIVFNNGAEQVFGYSQAEVIGTPLDNLIPERFRKIHRQHVERFASGAGTTRRVGERLITVAGLRSNGEEFPAEAAISKLQVGDKTLLTVALRDVTERKRLEKEQQLLTEAGAALATSLEYEETLANLARVVVQNFADWSAVDVMDEEGRLRRLKVASADPDQAALCAVLEQMPPDRDLPHLMRSVIESKRPIVVEQVTSEYIESLGLGPEHLQALLVTGVTSFVAVPLLIRGQPVGALFLGSSTPSLVFGQGDLRLAEALAEQAAIAIENARLYRASVHATQLRDQVLGIVAHDLRNPLSTILTQLWALRHHGPQPERRSLKPADVIERAAKHMNRLIQDLLDVAVMESGQLTIKRARLSARELIVGAVDMQRPLASSSSLELRVDSDRDVPDVWGDRDRLLQVFENLIGNAIKFTKAGGCITVGATSRDHEVIFRVADTGSGIAPENLSHVFDRFWQATSANRQGAGLGLPITKGIVEAHGGRIWVESTPSLGTTFAFTIPKATPDALLEGRRAA